MDTVEQLFARFASQGDVDALSEVFDRTAPALLRLSVQICGREAEAEDLLQATFLVAIEKARAFDPARSLTAWLVGILQKQGKSLRQRGQAGHGGDLARRGARLRRRTGTRDRAAADPLSRPGHRRVRRALRRRWSEALRRDLRGCQARAQGAADSKSGWSSPSTRRRFASASRRNGSASANLRSAWSCRPFSLLAVPVSSGSAPTLTPGFSDASSASGSPGASANSPRSGGKEEQALHMPKTTRHIARAMATPRGCAHTSRRNWREPAHDGQRGRMKNGQELHLAGPLANRRTPAMLRCSTLGYELQEAGAGAPRAGCN